MGDAPRACRACSLLLRLTHAQLTPSKHNRVKSERKELDNLLPRLPEYRLGSRRPSRGSVLTRLWKETKTLCTLNGVPRVTPKTSGRARRGAGVSGVPGSCCSWLRPSPVPARPRLGVCCLTASLLSSSCSPVLGKPVALFSPLCQPEAVNAPQTGKLTSVSLLALPVSVVFPLPLPPARWQLHTELC